MKPFCFRLCLFLVAAVAATVAAAQNFPVNPQPDCMANVNVGPFAAGGTTLVQFDNRFSVCDSWVVSYMSFGFTGITLTFQSAPDNNGSPGAFVVFVGSLISGLNPLTSTTVGETKFSGLNPWVRVQLVTVGASGAVNATFYGYKSNPGNASTNCPVVTPCAVQGAAAPGSAPSGNPVLIAGQDSTPLVRVVSTDASGRVQVVGPGAAGAAPVGNPVQSAGTDGANLRVFVTDATGRQIEVGAAASGAAVAGNPVLVGGSDGVNARSMSTDATGRPIVVVGSTVTGTDTVSNAAIETPNPAGLQLLAIAPWVFNGSSWNRLASASITNDSTPLGNNSVIAEKGGRWNLTNSPAVSTQATATRAAGGGQMQVVDCVGFSAGSTTAPALTQLKVNVIDGASGTTTFLKQFLVVISAVTGQNVTPFEVCGLNVHGTTGNALTIEFSALLTNLFEEVHASGYTLQ